MHYPALTGQQQIKSDWIFMLWRRRARATEPEQYWRTCSHRHTASPSHSTTTKSAILSSHNKLHIALFISQQTLSYSMPQMWATHRKRERSTDRVIDFRFRARLLRVFWLVNFERVLCNIINANRAPAIHHWRCFILRYHFHSNYSLLIYYYLF
jgi:hypothetical protein